MLKQSKKGGYYDIHKKNKDIPLFKFNLIDMGLGSYNVKINDIYT